MHHGAAPGVGGHSPGAPPEPSLAKPPPAQPPRRGWRRILGALGPGVVAGAADDDPSGVATYSIAGAQFGTSLLWTALLSWPLMAAVQLTCARVGMVTGQGLAAALRRKLPRPLLVLAAGALLVANTINIGADLVGMADAAAMLTGGSPRPFVVLFGIGITWATIRLRYAPMAGLLKWLALVLFAYVVTAFQVGPDWSAVVHDTFVPTLPHDRAGWAAVVAILGTTISPYLFFWQASQEVEEEKSHGRHTLARRLGATVGELEDRRLDVAVGTGFSNLVMYFIILTTALTLHRHGRVDIETSRQVASALRPLAGRLAELLYTLGLLGVGLLAIPTLSGSAAYAFAETFGWRQGLDEKLPRARAFYGVIAFATGAGIAMEFAGVSAVRALFWAAVINGVLAPFLLVGVLLVAPDREIMHGQPSSRLAVAVVALAAAVMLAAAAAMFAFG